MLKARGRGGKVNRKAIPKLTKLERRLSPIQNIAAHNFNSAFRICNSKYLEKFELPHALRELFVNTIDQATVVSRRILESEQPVSIERVPGGLIVFAGEFLLAEVKWKKIITSTSKSTSMMV